MGLVTVFSISGCQFCIKAKHSLTSHKIPFVEINLTLHPEKRSDMLSLSNSFAVPQIFFNEKHIGGATELMALLERWANEESFNYDGVKSTENSAANKVLEIFEREVKSHPDPTDPRLVVPTSNPIEYIELPRKVEDRIPIELSLDGVSISLSVLEVTSQLEEHLTGGPIISYRGWVYRNSFPKSDVLTALRSEFGKTAPSTASDVSSASKASEFSALTVPSAHGDEAEQWHQLIELLKTRTILQPVIGAPPSLLRLQCHHTPHILNSFRVWTDRVDFDSLAIVKRLTHILHQISSRSTEAETGQVNLQRAVRDSQYNTFQEGVCELQSVQMSEMDTSTRTAFVINVYNLMIKYAQIKLGIPDSNVQRAHYFGKIQMNIGGLLYSFNDLENGILRANRKAPYHFHKPFREDGSDPRTELALKEVDARIHFALNCGAASCPPVKEFTANGLEEELRVVAMAFCEQDENVSIPINQEGGNKKNLKIGLSKIFSWYRQDFCNNTNKTLPLAIVGFLRGKKKDTLEQYLGGSAGGGQSSVSVTYLPYDWTSATVSHAKVFHRFNLQSQFFSFKNLLPKECPSLAQVLCRSGNKSEKKRKSIPKSGQT